MVRYDAAMGPNNPPAAGLFDGLTDEQILKRAAAALRSVTALPLGSAGRAVKWSAYEAAKAELDLRLYAHIMRKLRKGEDS